MDTIIKYIQPTVLPRYCKSGSSYTSVFTVVLAGVTVPLNAVTPPIYYGRVRSFDNSGNKGSWTSLIGSVATLIDSAEITELTATKIKAGTITSSVIALDGVNSVIKSSGYVAGANGSGWAIKGDGNAEFSAASIRGGINAQSIFINADNRWRRNAGNTAVSTDFKVGSDTKYLYYDGNASITFTGNLSAVGGTFTGALSAASGTFQGRLEAGDIYIPNATSPKFKVDAAGNMTCVDATINGTLNGVGGTFTGTLNGVDGSFDGDLSGATGTFSGGLSVTSGNITVGDVRLGDLGGHYGLSLSTSNFENIFLRRAGDNAIFFRVDTGSGHYIRFENGTLNIAAYGTVTFGNGVTIGENCYIRQSLFTDGNVRVNQGTNNPKTALNTKGDSNSSSAYFALVAERLDGTNILEARCDSKVLVYGGASNISATSDVRSKTDIKDLDIGLDLINQLRPVSYRRMDNFQHLMEEKENFVPVYKDYTEYGLISQEVKELIDDGKLTIAVWDEGATGSQSLAYIGLFAPMIKAIQELSAKVASLESKMV